MKLKKFLTEANWKRRQLRKGQPYWVYDKYEITKEPDGKFKLVDISQMTNNQPTELGRFDSLKKAKDSVNEDISFIWEEEMKEAAYRFNIGFEEMVKFYQTADPRQVRRMEKIIKANDWRKFKALIKEVLGVELR